MYLEKKFAEFIQSAIHTNLKVIKSRCYDILEKIDKWRSHTEFRNQDQT